MNPYSIEDPIKGPVFEDPREIIKESERKLYFISKIIIAEEVETFLNVKSDEGYELISMIPVTSGKLKPYIGVTGYSTQGDVSTSVLVTMKQRDHR